MNGSGPSQPASLADREAILGALLDAGELVIGDGIDFARQDDPHRLATLHREFDGGKARRQLRIDYMADGIVSVSLVLLGTKQDEPFEVALFTTIAQGPLSGTKQ